MEHKINPKVKKKLDIKLDAKRRGNYLSKYLIRLRGRRSLRQIAGDHFAPQTLHNYENAKRFPSRKDIPALASCYNCDNQELDIVYCASQAQFTKGDLTQEIFLDALNSAQRGDHIIISGQKSPIPSRPEIASSIVELLKREVNFTYITYAPNAGDHTIPYEWRSNHEDVAQILQRKIKRAIRKTSKKLAQVQFMLINKPDERDYFYLAGPDTSIYLNRNPESIIQSPDGWFGRRSPNGKYRFSPFDNEFLEDFHDWIINHCGLQAPSSKKNDKTLTNINDRDLSIVTLDEFLNHSNP